MTNKVIILVGKVRMKDVEKLLDLGYTVLYRTGK